MEIYHLVLCCMIFTTVATFTVPDAISQYSQIHNDSLPQTAESQSCKCVNGRCVTNNAGKTVCLCKPGYALQDEFTCEPCDCGTRGKCLFIPHSKSRGEFMYEKKCICDVGSAVKDGTCIDCFCGENSACDFEGEEKNCYCIEGYSEKEGVCTKCDCGFYGECKFDNGQKICTCDEGHLEVEGSCKECNCGDKGECKFENGAKYCTCHAGYKVNQGICEECNCGIYAVNCGFTDGKKSCGCFDRFSDKNGVCEECYCGSGSWGCNFYDDYKKCGCKEGYEQKGEVCEECNCGANSLGCSFKENSKECQCKEGYVQKGGMCEAGCSEYHQCQHGGHCKGGFCDCFAGTSGEFCEYIEECDYLCPKQRNIACDYDVFQKKPFCKCLDADLKFDTEYKQCKRTCDRDYDCHNGGNCDGNRFCKCLEGTSGDFCEIVPGCNTKNCGYDAKCGYSVDRKSAVCVCDDVELTFNENERVCKRTCNRDYDCHNGGKCGGNRFCDCLRGTSGDLCEIVSECETKDCGHDAVCVYSGDRQSAVCKCKDEKMSFDENEQMCKRTCDHGYDCHNGGKCDGNRLCDCLKGTSGDLCEIVSECDSKDCGNDAKCVYSVDRQSAVCECADGKLTFDENERMCKRTCDHGYDCHNGGKCDGNRFCDCLKGTSGDLCEIVPECDTKDCGYDAKCGYNVIRQSAVCECGDEILSFDELERVCKRSCDEGDMCENGGTCIFKGYSRFCDCLPGTKGDMCEIVDGCMGGGTTCKDDARCVFDVKRQKARCECPDNKQRYDTLSEKCKSTCYEDANCKNGGLCMHRGDYLFCECMSGTRGMNCETVDDCVKGLCGYTNAVDCVYDITREAATCKCKNSEHLFDPESKTCKACDCGKDAVSCKYVNEKKVCTCRNGYEVKDGICRKTQCIEKNCPNGKCLVFDDKEVCSCYEGYAQEGDYCKKLNCTKTPCINGTCVVRHGNKEQCICQAGYSLSNGICVKGACKPHTCFGGRCETIDGELTCVCPPKFHLEGVGCYETVCTIQRCFGGQCLVNEKKEETCTCKEGYILVNDVCKLVLCKKPCYGGQCKFIDGKEECICPPGFFVFDDVCREDILKKKNTGIFSNITGWRNAV